MVREKELQRILTVSHLLLLGLLAAKDLLETRLFLQLSSLRYPSRARCLSVKPLGQCANDEVLCSRTSISSGKGSLFDGISINRSRDRF